MADQLVRPLLSIVNALRAAHASLTGPATGLAGPASVLTADEHHALVAGLCRGVLRPATGGAVSSGAGVSALSEAPRVASSTFYRGWLYACLTRVLYVSLSPSDDGADTNPAAAPGGAGAGAGRRQYSDELKDSGAGLGFPSANVGASHASDCRARDVAVLEQCAGELADLLGADATTGPALWRVSALAALTGVLTALSPARADGGDAASPGHGYVTVLKTLVLRGHLAAILEYVGPADRASTSGSHTEEELFTAATSLCVALASTREGCVALLDGRFMPRVGALPYFRYPPPSPEEILPFGPDGAAMRDEACATLVSRLAPVLRALRCLCSTLPAADALAGTAAFLLANQRTVTYLLRLRMQTLRGLELTEGVLALLVAVAAAPCVDADALAGANKQARLSLLHGGAPAVPAAGPRPPAQPLWDSALGPSGAGDGFTNDVCALLRLLGTEPLPAQVVSALTGTGGLLGVGLGLSRGGDPRAPSGWWARFAPTTDEEQRWLQTTMPGSDRDFTAAAAQLAGWSIFDQKKASAALRTLTLCSSFARVRASACANGSSAATRAGLLAIDFDAVVGAFCRGAELAHALEGSADPTGWMTGAASAGRPEARGALLQALLPAVRLLTENLVCVLHDMHVASTPEERAGWAGGLDRALATCERLFPATDSFVGRVGRHLRDAS